MKSDIWNYDELGFNFTQSEMLSVCPGFPTKKQALEKAKDFGWSTAIKIVRRFETVYVVGKKDFETSTDWIGDYEIWRFPLLRWEEVNGHKENPVFVVTQRLGM